MARTTIDIDKPILSEIREIQKQEGGSMGEVASRLMAEALLARRSAPSQPMRFEWRTRSMRPLVDLSDKDALYAALDREAE